MDMRNVSSVSVVEVRSVPIESDESNEEWQEIEVKVEFRSRDRLLKVEALPFLRFKQIVKEADARGIEIKRSAAPCSSCSAPSFDVVEFARQVIKDEKSDPSVA